MNLPFEGIKILDFSQAVFGPACTQLLGQLGAEVIKVEPIEGDFTRVSETGIDSTVFLACNVCKKSIYYGLEDNELINLRYNSKIEDEYVN